MYLEDFEYNGERLSSFGYMPCSIVTSVEDSVSLGSSLNFNSVVNNGTYVTEYTDISFSENITTTFDIAKKSCDDEMYFSKAEISYIMKWLNREEVHKFIPIYDEEKYDTVYYMGTFNDIKAITIGGHVLGFTVTFTANAPWGFIDNRDFEVTVSEENGTFTLYEDSDRTGYVYPTKMTITCNNTEKSSLVLSNSLDDRELQINNVMPGEVITLNCQSRIITSSLEHSTLYNDFNYNFPRIISTDTSDLNVFTVSIPCTITVEHHPIRKVGVL